MDECFTQLRFNYGTSCFDLVLPPNALAEEDKFTLQSKVCIEALELLGKILSPAFGRAN